MVIVCTGAALVTLLEVDRLVSSLVAGAPDSPSATDYEGMTASIAQVTGFGSFDHRDAWGIWEASAAADQIGSLAGIYFWLDLLFIAGYSVLIAQITWRFKPALWAGLIAAGIDVIEGFALILAADSAASGWVFAVALAARLKWLALGIALLLLFASGEARGALSDRARRLGSAMKAHALSLIFLAGFAVLALVPSTGIFDQIPDVQRQWVNDGAIEFASPVWAGGVLLLTGLIFWYLGRQRTEVAHWRFSTGGSLDELPASSNVWWVSVPYGLLWIAVIASASGSANGSVGWAIPVGVVLTFIVAGLIAIAQIFAGDAERRPVLIFCGVLFVVLLAVPIVWLAVTDAAAWINFGPLAILLLIALIVVIGSGFVTIDPLAAPTPTEDLPDAARSHTVWLVGDAIAVLVVALGPLTVLRSFTAPVVIANVFDGNGDGVPELAHLASASGVMLGAAIVGVVCVPVIGFLILSKIDRGTRPLLLDPKNPTPDDSIPAKSIDVAMVALGAVVVGVATLWPVAFASIGPIAVTVSLLTAWGLMLGGLILSFQRRQPMPIFRQFGLRGTPVLGLVVVCAVATSLFFADPRVHAVRVLPDSTTQQSRGEAESPHMAAAGDTGDKEAVQQEEGHASADSRFTSAIQKRFDDWESATAKSCPDSNVRPLILVAAEGGGGRAAFWTIQGLRVLREYGGACLQSAVFAASGISGGSVGLVVDQMESAKDRESGAATDAISDLVAPAPLSRVVTALLAGDMVAGLTGARVADPAGTWLDRAGHLESAWAEATALPGHNPSSLNTPFSDDPAINQPFLILNSADAVSGCRISVVQLPTPTGHDTSSPKWTDRLSPDACGRTDSGAGYSLAFEEVWPGCSDQLRWSTTALLSARFPYVTPAGWMPVSGSGGCEGAVEDPGVEGRPQAQLVDGGYSDDTGLAAIADLLPELLPRVAQHNASGPTRILPVVLYLKNDRGFELDATVKQLAAEVFVPLAALDARSLQNRESAWLQRLSDDLETIELADRADVNDVLAGSRIVVVSPDTVPTPIPPLGWTLSEFSRVVLETAANQQACSIGKYEADVARLGDLFDAFPAAQTAKSCTSN